MPKKIQWTNFYGSITFKIYIYRQCFFSANKRNKNRHPHQFITGKIAHNAVKKRERKNGYSYSFFCRKNKNEIQKVVVNQSGIITSTNICATFCTE